MVRRFCARQSAWRKNEATQRRGNIPRQEEKSRADDGAGFLPARNDISCEHIYILYSCGKGRYRRGKCDIFFIQGDNGKEQQKRNQGVF